MITGADRLYEEIAYVAFHFHWSHGEILDLAHRDRCRYVTEIGRLNQRLADGE